MRPTTTARLVLVGAVTALTILAGGAAHAGEPGTDTGVRIVIEEGHECVATDGR